MRHLGAFATVGLLVLVGCSSGEQAPRGGAGAGGGAGMLGAGGSPVSGNGGSPSSGAAGMGLGGGVMGGTAGSTSAGAAGSDSAGRGGAGAAGTSAGDAGTMAAGAGSPPGGAAGSSGSAGSAGSGGAAGALSGTPTEETLAALDTVRQEHGVGALDGEIYVVGGYVPQATDTVRAYSPATMTWRDAPDFPGALNHGNVGSANGKLYVLGFFDGGDQTTANPQSFAFDGTSWEEVEPSPTGTQRAAACVASLGDRIYLFGGRHEARSVALASVYDAVGDAWTELPDMPVAREHCVAGAIGGKIYIAAGRTDDITAVEASTLEFDPQNPSYVQKQPIPTPRGGVAGAVLGGRLFVFGGEGNDDDPAGVFPDIESYDPVTDEWEAHPPMDVPRHGMGAAELEGRIYLPAGADRQGGGAVDTVSVFYYD
jgi:N-acetylneuraminic acid mutarotase